jgi:hypothetical protein
MCIKSTIANLSGLLVLYAENLIKRKFILQGWQIVMFKFQNVHPRTCMYLLSTCMIFL